MSVSTAGSRSSSVSGTHSIFRFVRFSSVLSPSAIFWQSSTENPAGFPDGSLNENGLASLR